MVYRVCLVVFGPVKGCEWTSLYCTSQLLCFLQIEGKTLHQQKDDDVRIVGSHSRARCLCGAPALSRVTGLRVFEFTGPLLLTDAVPPLRTEEVPSRRRDAWLSECELRGRLGPVIFTVSGSCNRPARRARGPVAPGEPCALLIHGQVGAGRGGGHCRCGGGF